MLRGTWSSSSTRAKALGVASQSWSVPAAAGFVVGAKLVAHRRIEFGGAVEPDLAVVQPRGVARGPNQKSSNAFARAGLRRAACQPLTKKELRMPRRTIVQGGEHLVSAFLVEWAGFEAGVSKVAAKQPRSTA